MLKKLTYTLITLVAFTYLGAAAYLWWQQEALLFFPAPERPAEAALLTDYDTVFDVNGQTLDGWFVPGSTGTTIVYYGGNAEELSRRVDNLVALGDHNYLLINYRGYGDSTGRPGEAALKADALAILDAAAARFGFDLADTLVLGRSLGSGVATAVVANRPVKALVLITPYDSIRAVAQGRYPFIPVGMLLRHPFDSLQYLEAIEVPTLVIKAATDNVVPHRHTDALTAAWQSTAPLSVITLPGSHSSVVDSRAFNDAITSFIDTLP